MLNVYDIKEETYQPEGKNITTAIFTHRPTGIFVSGKCSSITDLRKELHFQLDTKINDSMKQFVGQLLN